MGEPKIMVQEKLLSILIAQDGDKFCAYCPELDLVTEMDTPGEAVDDIIESLKDYAREYMDELDMYSKSPDRAHHLPYVRAISSCKTDWELMMLIEIKHGLVYV